MMEIINSLFGVIIDNPLSFWLSFGGLLLVAEMLGTAGYLLWSGIAAICTALVSWFIPNHWAWQGGIFALLIVVIAWLWWRWSRRLQKCEQNSLNQRNKQLVGQRFYLETPIINHQGNIRIADGSWPVYASKDLPVGTQIQIISIDGITLRVEPC